MATPMVGSVVLFLGSDLAFADRIGSHPSTLAWMTRFVVPPALVIKGAETAAGTEAPEDRPYPPEQVMRAQQVLDEARRLHRTVKIVDVNGPGEDAPLVKRFVRSDDLLPVLVRADGARLVGEDELAPARLRPFLAGA